ncbi:unnamed protein product [Hydatigera taeniaeformis]|uniref:Uncharacterized protein n=1 Tax=Hydatigena taeniaeformis TaxID=6205 RepID=A0A0R3X308_HYDTA|nr:unnamed protein product [Hydatigera taeniaeformis]
MATLGANLDANMDIRSINTVIMMAWAEDTAIISSIIMAMTIAICVGGLPCGTQEAENIDKCVNIDHNVIDTRIADIAADDGMTTAATATVMTVVMIMFDLDVHNPSQMQQRYQQMPPPQQGQGQYQPPQEQQQQQQQPPPQQKPPPPELEELRKNVFKGIKEFSKSLKKQQWCGDMDYVRSTRKVKHGHKDESLEDHRKQSRRRDWIQHY